MKGLIAGEPDNMDNFDKICDEMTDVRFRLAFVTREIVELEIFELEA
jgi:hypothetical protein